MLKVNEDYRLRGYHKKKTQDVLGDRTLIEYFESFVGGVYSNLKVRETRTYTRAAVTGILTTVVVDIEWMSGDGVTPRATKQITKNLDSDDGMASNSRSRKRLLNKAKGAAIQLIGMQSGKAFMRTLGLEIGLYKEGDTQPLIDGINASAQSQTFKTTLIGILDVTYIPV